MKKLITLLLCGIFTALCHADTETANGIEWTYTIKNGEAIIGYGDGSWTPAIPYTTSGSITVPATLGGCPVTSIGFAAFSGCDNLKSITLPTSVTTIEEYAFDCANLYKDEYAMYESEAKVVLIKALETIEDDFIVPNSVRFIHSHAFAASKVNSVIIPEGVRTIGYLAFAECWSLTSVILPISLIEIEDYAFYDCSKLTSIVIPTNVKSIGENAFYNCSGVTSVTIPASVKTIGDNAFLGVAPTTLTAASIPSGMSTENLTTVIIPEGVTAINSNAFSGCYQVTSFTIPNSVATIGHYALPTGYSDETGLYKDERGVIYESEKKVALLSAPNDLSGEYQIPEGVRFIMTGAFSYRSDLTSIKIPSSVLSIGRYAFQGCSGLTSVEIATPSNLNRVERDAFSCCSSLTAITIPSNVPTIEANTFAGCSSLTSVMIPSSVTVIGYQAFSGCGKLTSVEIPSSVTVVDERAFSGCEGLTLVTIPSSVTYIGDFALSVGKTTAIIFEGVPPQTSSSSPFTMDGFGYYYSCNALAWQTAIALDASSPDPNGGYWKNLKMYMIETDGDAGDVAVAIDIVGEGAVNGAGSYEAGSIVTLTALPGANAVFCGWSDTSLPCEKNVTITVPEEGVVLTAYFAPKEAIDKYVDGQDFVTSAELNAKIQEYVKTNNLISKDEVKELALGAPVIEVKDGVATVNVALQKASSLNGEWEDAATIEAEITPKADEKAAFYKFVVPNEQ